MMHIELAMYIERAVTHYNSGAQSADCTCVPFSVEV